MVSKQKKWTHFIRSWFFDFRAFEDVWISRRPLLKCFVSSGREKWENNQKKEVACESPRQKSFFFHSMASKICFCVAGKPLRKFNTNQKIYIPLVLFGQSAIHGCAIFPSASSSGCCWGWWSCASFISSSPLHFSCVFVCKLKTLQTRKEKPRRALVDASAPLLFILLFRIGGKEGSLDAASTRAAAFPLARRTTLSWACLKQRQLLAQVPSSRRPSLLSTTNIEEAPTPNFFFPSSHFRASFLRRLLFLCHRYPLTNICKKERFYFFHWLE